MIEQYDHLSLGDAGYPASRYLLTPFRLEGCTRRERRLIHAHGAIRYLIENIFGILSTKFDRIKDFRPTSTEMALKVILAIACLWNMLQTMGDHRWNVFTNDKTRSRRRDYSTYELRPDLKDVLTCQEKIEILSEWLEDEGLF